MPPSRKELADLVSRLGISDDRLLDAFRAIPRAAFVPSDLEDRAYNDEPLPIPHGQVTTQPYLVARMIEALELDGTETVLEVGTGYGFQTALLARLASFVFSVERWPDIAETARENLLRQGVTNVDVRVGDGSAGLPEQAPFDAILVSAAYPEVPPPLANQLGPDGRLVQPIGIGGNENVDLFHNTPRGLVRVGVIIGAHFVRLYGAHGFPEEENEFEG